MAPTPGKRMKTSAQHSPASGSPSRPPLIERDDLLAALDRAAAGQVTIIAAPAGSGKTTLLRAWAARPAARRRLATVQVQRGRQDAQLFWLALLRAVGELSGAASGAEQAAPSPDFSGAAAVDRILAELAALADGGDHLVLAIDDVHELTSPNTLADLTRLLAGLPPGTHAILATRRDLPLRLHQLRLAGELAELRATDLRFTEQEARDLLAASGITLSDAGARLLYQRTEGWVAGLRLAAISLDGHPDPERFVAEFSGSSRTVAEYLVAEMLERQPEDVQNLLLRTSILERVNGELADLLTGRPGGERILLDLEDANAFVVSLDPERTWFRYHHLFADLLRLELRRRLPGEVDELHRAAADWFTRRGRIVEAVPHRQAAGDWAEAAALLADHSFGMMLDGQEETMQALLRAFPRSAAAAGADGPSGGPEHPELSIVRTIVDLVHGRLDEAAAHLSATDLCLKSLPAERRRRLRVVISSLELSLARRRGNIADVLRHAEFLTSPAGGASEDENALGSDLRVMALMNLGTVEAWSLELTDGPRHLREGAELARRIGRPYLEVACLAQLGFAAKLPLFGSSRQRCEEAVALAEEHGWGTAWILAPALVSLACTMVWVGEFDNADHMLERTDAALQTDSGPAITTMFHLVKGMLHIGRGEPGDAHEAFASALDLQSRLADRLRHRLDPGHPGPPRRDRRGPRRARGTRRRAGRLGRTAHRPRHDLPRRGRPGRSPGRAGTRPQRRRAGHPRRHARRGGTAARAGPARARRPARRAPGGRARAGPGRAGTADPAVRDDRGRRPARDVSAPRVGARRAADRRPRRGPRHLPAGRGRAAARGPAAQPHRTAGAAIPADQPVQDRDRPRAVRLGQHGQHARAQHLREAPGHRPVHRRPAGQGAAAARARPGRPVAETHRIRVMGHHQSVTDDGGE